MNIQGLGRISQLVMGVMDSRGWIQLDSVGILPFLTPQMIRKNSSERGRIGLDPPLGGPTHPTSQLFWICQLGNELPGKLILSSNGF